MTVDEMRDYADKYSPAYSKGKSGGYSPWYTEFDKMSQKTVLRQLLSKWGPTSTYMQKVEILDEQPQEKPKKAANSGEYIDVTPVTVDKSTGEVIGETPAPAEFEELPVIE